MSRSRATKLAPYFPQLEGLPDSDIEAIFERAHHRVMVGQRKAGSWTLVSVAIGISFALVGLLLIIGILGLLPFETSLVGPIVGGAGAKLYQVVDRRRYLNMIRPVIESELGRDAT